MITPRENLNNWKKIEFCRKSIACKSCKRHFSTRAITVLDDVSLRNYSQSVRKKQFCALFQCNIHLGLIKNVKVKPSGFRSSIQFCYIRSMTDDSSLRKVLSICSRELPSLYPVPVVWTGFIFESKNSSTKYFADYQPAWWLVLNDRSVVFTRWWREWRNKRLVWALKNENLLCSEHPPLGKATQPQ